MLDVVLLAFMFLYCLAVLGIMGMIIYNRWRSHSRKKPKLKLIKGKMNDKRKY